tara:strand:+ start:2438 stop:2539 length:102 start_codon:yes stop_codon:yes gene_type:complete
MVCENFILTKKRKNIKTKLTINTFNIIKSIDGF